MNIFRPVHSTFFVLITVALAVGAVGYRNSEKLQEVIRGNKVPDVELPITQQKTPYKYSKEYSFTDDWFSSHIPSWEIALSEYKGKPNIQYLEIGVFEGRAVLWVAENILTDPSSKMTCLDLFEGSYNSKFPNFADRYFSNIKLFGEPNRIQSIKGYSQLELRKLPLDFYDIIYIDGSHENHDVLEDAILANRLLKKGGTLIFDDYARNEIEFIAPKFGIDSFYRFYGSGYVVIHNDHQVIMKKK